MAYKSTQVRNQGRTATGPKRKKNVPFTPKAYKSATTKVRLNKIRNERLTRDRNPKKFAAKKVKAAVKKYDTKKAGEKKVMKKYWKKTAKSNKAFHKARAKTGVSYVQWKKDTAPKPKKVKKVTKLGKFAKSQIKKAFPGKKKKAPDYSSYVDKKAAKGMGMQTKAIAAAVARAKKKKAKSAVPPKKAFRGKKAYTRLSKVGKKKYTLDQLKTWRKSVKKKPTPKPKAPPPKTPPKKKKVIKAKVKKTFKETQMEARRKRAKKNTGRVFGVKGGGKKKSKSSRKKSSPSLKGQNARGRTFGAGGGRKRSKSSATGLKKLIQKGVGSVKEGMRKGRKSQSDRKAEFEAKSKIRKDKAKARKIRNQNTRAKRRANRR